MNPTSTAQSRVRLTRLWRRWCGVCEDASYRSQRPACPTFWHRRNLARWVRMSSHRDPWLLCDGCNSQQFPEDAGEGAFVDETIRTLRAGAKENGWRTTRTGRDLCPDCAGGAS